MMLISKYIALLSNQNNYYYKTGIKCSKTLRKTSETQRKEEKIYNMNKFPVKVFILAQVCSKC